MTTTEPGHDDAVPSGHRHAPSASSRSSIETVVLAAQPAAVSAARRFVRKVLVGSDAWFIEDAALVVTELVANAVLHAGGPITLTIDVRGDGPRVRLEVEDSSPVPPVLREYGTVASTGRGLTLVARLAVRWGVEPVESGKRVWAEVAPVEPASSRTVSPPTSRIGVVNAVDADAVPVRFEGVPVSVYLRLQEQNDAVLRELELLAFTADHAGHLEPSPQLMDVIERSRQHFNHVREGFRGEVAAAAERGETTIDLVGSASMAALAPSADRVQLFEEAEDLARRGELLIGPADADVARLRRWFVEELSSQLSDNTAPQAFSG